LVTNGADKYAMLHIGRKLIHIVVGAARYLSQSVVSAMHRETPISHACLVAIGLADSDCEVICVHVRFV
jgi:hypothetical protein